MHWQQNGDFVSRYWHDHGTFKILKKMLLDVQSRDGGVNKMAVEDLSWQDMPLWRLV
jgi:hypothetical protein